MNVSGTENIHPEYFDYQVTFQAAKCDWQDIKRYAHFLLKYFTECHQT